MQTASKILDWREGSSMASHWREYLCLRKGYSKRFKIFIGGYASLADADEFYDEKSNDYILPTHISGIKVVGVEDGSVVGGEPEYYDDADQIEFDDPNEPELADWLRTNSWIEQFESIRRSIRLI